MFIVNFNLKLDSEFRVVLRYLQVIENFFPSHLSEWWPSSAFLSSSDNRRIPCNRHLFIAKCYKFIPPPCQHSEGFFWVICHFPSSCALACMIGAGFGPGLPTIQAGLWLYSHTSFTPQTWAVPCAAITPSYREAAVWHLCPEKGLMARIGVVVRIPFAVASGAILFVHCLNESSMATWAPNGYGNFHFWDKPAIFASNFPPPLDSLSPPSIDCFQALSSHPSISRVSLF